MARPSDWFVLDPDEGLTPDGFPNQLHTLA